jgi:hypothetical protein
MFRTRLAAAALLFVSLLPGCGLLCGDRPRLCERWRGSRVEASPVSFPMGDSGCGGMMIPPGGGIGPGGMTTGPVIIGPGGMPYENLNNVPRPIPGARIGEEPGEVKPGRPYELGPTNRTGPVLMIPANGGKGN